MSETSRPEVGAGVSALLAERGLRIDGVSLVAQGNQGELRRIEARDGDGTVRAFAEKRFTAHYRHNSEAAVVAEYEALRAFHPAIAARGADAVTCPAPIGLIEGELTYVMEWVEAETLDTHLRRGVDDRVPLAERVLLALEVFYAATDQIYGDFQPGNVLVAHDGVVVMIDPTIPNPFYYEQARGIAHPAAADLGYWVYTAGLQSVKQRLLDPRLRRARAEFTRALLCGAAARFSSARASFLDEVRRAARGHLTRAARKRRDIRHRVLHAVGGLAIGAMVRSARG